MSCLPLNCPTCFFAHAPLFPCLVWREHDGISPVTWSFLWVATTDGDGAVFFWIQQGRIPVPNKVPMFREFKEETSASQFLTMSCCSVFNISKNRLLILLPSFSRCYCNFEQWRMEYLQSTGALVHHPVNTTDIWYTLTVEKAKGH